MAKTIEDYKKDYAAAAAAGDAAAMKAANDGANAIRAATGQKAEYATDDINTVANGGVSGMVTSGKVKPSNTSTSNKTTAPSGFTGSAAGVNTYNKDQASIIAQMNANSQAWFDADEATQKALHEENQRLAAQLGGSVSFDPKTGYWGGSAAKPVLPEYSSTRSPQIDSLLDAILNREPFSYDHTTDPTYLAYEQQYKRLGDRAREDTLGDVAGLTGGYASSWATSAASQAQNDYNQQLSGIIPTLYDAAYGRYMDEDSMKRNDLGLLLDIDQIDYNRYRDLVGDSKWQTEFDYGAYRDSVADSQWDKNFDLSKDQFGLSKDQFEWNKTVDDFNMKAQEQTTKFNQMMEKWNMTGVADNEVAAYLGVPVGATTESYYFNKANLALNQAKQAQSNKESNKVNAESEATKSLIISDVNRYMSKNKSYRLGAEYLLGQLSDYGLGAADYYNIGAELGIDKSYLEDAYFKYMSELEDEVVTTRDKTYWKNAAALSGDPLAFLTSNQSMIVADGIDYMDLYLEIVNSGY